MSNLISLDNVSLAFGLDALLDNVKFQISKGERVCLIGRNGAGKSSLLKIIEGTLLPDSGSVWRQPQLRIARLAQELPNNSTLTVYEFVSEGIAGTGALLAEYHALTHALSQHQNNDSLKKLEVIQHKIDAVDGWTFELRINTILTRLELNPEQRINELSGGWQRRAALARALVSDPELLLLDEPTNHLDIEAIQWLEEQLLSAGCALLFITHDRALLQRLATRIIELDRGNLTSWPGDYSNFLRHKDELLHAEARLNAEFDKKLAQEERWIRQGIKARRTRNEGRVRALEELRRVRSKRREVQSNASFNVNEGEKSGQLIIEAKNISQSFNNKSIIKDFSMRIMRGDRIGLIGPNGVGKSTLLNILLTKLAPQEGSVNLGTRLQIAYFDQLRQALNYEKTVIENVVEGSDTIEINGQQQHVISYLGDFLFTPQRARTPVKALSGGECNRLLLAKLFSQPANLLIMDEPTNDLDIETLELLEELLGNYAGTLLIVSHDRVFLDNVVTSTLIFEGEGKILESIGGYHDWLRYKNQLIETKPIAKATGSEFKNINTKPVKKLSFKEQKELSELPSQIEKMELELQSIQALTSQSDFYKQGQEKISQAMDNIASLEEKLRTAYARWQELESYSKIFKN